MTDTGAVPDLRVRAPPPDSYRRVLPSSLAGLDSRACPHYPVPAVTSSTVALADLSNKHTSATLAHHVHPVLAVDRR